MLREVLFVLFSFIVCWRGAYPFLDIDELKNIHYDIDIVDQPVLLGRDVENEVIYMKSKYGQQYECQMPDITEIELEIEEEKTASEVGVSELLKPMESAPCLKKTKDWWSYEFCYGKYIKQYHLENNKIVGDEMVLGYYESETNWEDTANADSKKNRLNRYHSHIYVNGSKCDLNGTPRQTEVKFLCAEGEGDSIARVDEPSTCAYIFTIHTTKICHHPYLKPPPKMKPKSVICAPALSQYQFDTYLYYQQISKLKEQEELQERREKERKIVAELEKVEKLAKEGTKEAVDDADTDIEDALQEVIAKYSSAGVEVKGLEEAQSYGVTPQKLAKLLEKLLGSVTLSIDGVDEELVEKKTTKVESKTPETESGLETVNPADQKNDDDEDDEEEDEEDEEEDEEETEFLEKDYKTLLKDFKDGIPGMDVGTDDEARLEALAEELQKSFQYLENIENLMETELNEMDQEITKLAKETTAILNDEKTDMGQSDATKTPDDAWDTGNTEDTGDDDEEEDDVEEGGEKEEVEQEEDEDGDDLFSDIDDAVSSNVLAEKLNEVIKDLKKGTESGTSKNTLNFPKDEDDDEDDGRVKVKVTKIKMNKDSKTTMPERETSLYDTEHRKLEEAIEDHLQQAGVKVEGGKIEVKVLSFSADDWSGQSEDDGVTILSEEESTYFKNMVLGLLGSQGAKEEKQHQKLRSNYNFHWGAENHRVEDEEDV